MHEAERAQLDDQIQALQAEIAVLRDIHNTPIVEPFAMAATGGRPPIPGVSPQPNSFEVER